ALFLFPECRNGNTQIYRLESTARCFSSKPAGLPPVAVVVDLVAAAMNSGVIVSAIGAQIRSSTTSPPTRSAPTAENSFIVQPPAVAARAVDQAALARTRRRRSCFSSTPTGRHHNPVQVV